MIIDCVADLNGFYPKLEGGDLLIVAGDLTARDTSLEYDQFVQWILQQNYKCRIIIAGNHDNKLQGNGVFSGLWDDPPRLIYLCDSGTEFEGFKIFGSPWTKTFEGMNPKCKAFTCETEEELASKFSLIPEDTDILITHGPPLAMMDRNSEGECCGSASLCGRLGSLNLKLHVFGHLHEHGGKVQYPIKQEGLPNYFDLTNTIFVNCSHVNEFYKPVNKPIRVIL